MKVILLKNVKNVGQANDIVDATDGYARNFLLARGLAKIADPSSLVALNVKRQAEETREKKLVKYGQELRKKLESMSLQFEKPGSPAGTLYAGLKEFDILAKLREMVAELPEDVRLVDYEALKQAGEYEVTIKLSPAVSAKFKLSIKANAQK